MGEVFAMMRTANVERSFEMTEEEYQNELDKLQKMRNELDARYALSNSPYNVGDIIQDHYHIIKIEKIGTCKKYNGWPQCLYLGIELTKSLEPKKRQLNPEMFQENVKRKIQ